MNWNEIIIAIALTLFLLLCVLFLAGCRVVWTDDLFYGSLFTQQDFDEGYLCREPNRIEVKLIKYRANPENLKMLTPYGAVETGD